MATTAPETDTEGGGFVDFTPVDDNSGCAAFPAGGLDCGDVVTEVLIPVLPFLPAMEIRILFLKMVEEYHRQHPELRHVDEAAVYQLHFVPFVRDLFTLMSAKLAPMLPSMIDDLEVDAGQENVRLEKVMQFLSDNGMPHCSRMVWGSVMLQVSSQSSSLPSAGAGGSGDEDGSPGGGALQDRFGHYMRGRGLRSGGTAYPFSPDEVMLVGRRQHYRTTGSSDTSDGEDIVSLPSPFSLVLPNAAVSPQGERREAAVAEALLLAPPASRSLLYLLQPSGSRSGNSGGPTTNQQQLEVTGSGYPMHLLPLPL